MNVALDLIGAMRWRGESAPALALETRTILGHGAAIGAVGFILARTDPDEDYYPNRQTVLAVSKLRHFSAEFDLPLLDYLVFSVGQTFSVGGPNVRSD